MIVLSEFSAGQVSCLNQKNAKLDTFCTFQNLLSSLFCHCYLPSAIFSLRLLFMRRCFRWIISWKFSFLLCSRFFLIILLDSLCHFHFALALGPFMTNCEIGQCLNIRNVLPLWSCNCWILELPVIGCCIDLPSSVKFWCCLCQSFFKMHCRDWQM